MLITSLLCKTPHQFIILPSCLPCFQLHPLVVGGAVVMCVMEEEEEVMRETWGGGSVYIFAGFQVKNN
jgi:hypothetical protein